MTDFAIEKLLLKSALLDSKTAYESFIRWEQNVDFEEISSDSYFLLPVVYKNLKELISESRLFPRIKGVYKKTWLENQLRIPKLEQIFNEFNNKSIDYVVLNNGFDVWNQNNDIATFSLAGFEILIKPKDSKKMTTILQEIGWTRSDKNLFPYDFINFNYKNQFAVNIFWQMDFFAKDVWENSTTSKLNNVSIKKFSSSDQILYLCRNTNYLTRQSFLVNSVLENDQDFNWDKITTKANILNLSSNLLQILECLKECSNLKIPQDVISKLSTNTLEELKPNKIRLASAYKSLRRTYLRNCSAERTKPTETGFIKFLCRHWGVNSVFALPWQIGKRFYRQINN